MGGTSPLLLRRNRTNPVASVREFCSGAYSYAEAQSNLGVMYTDGQGVPQDYAQAVSWYRKAADQGYAIAQFNLGNMYALGQGVPQDYIQAHMWWNLAASRYTDPTKRASAVKNRDLVAAKMTPAQIAEAQRLASAWKPKSPQL